MIKLEGNLAGTPSNSASNPSKNCKFEGRLAGAPSNSPSDLQENLFHTPAGGTSEADVPGSAGCSGR